MKLGAALFLIAFIGGTLASAIAWFYFLIQIAKGS